MDQPSTPGIKTRVKPTAATTVLRILALLIVIAITVGVYLIRDRVDEFTAFGYPGIFLVSLLANATIILPAPGVAVVFAMGGVFHPFGVALAASLGGALGELTGFLAGFSGRTVVEKTKVYERLTAWVKKYGPPSLVVLAAIPNPFFDMAGVAAGVLKMPVWKFLLFCWMGQLLKMMAFAYAGNYSINWLID